jgi:hypothetical protein
MERPQESLVGLGSGVLDLYSANKLRKMDAEFDRILSDQAAGTAITLRAIENVADLQIASMHMIRECDHKLDILAKISWDIASYFDRKEQQEAYIADMRYAVHTMTRALDRIDSLTEVYPEDALYQTDQLIEMIEKRDVRVEHFAKPPQIPEDMRLAQDMLDRVENTRRELVSIVEGSEGVKEYRFLTKTMKTITTRSNKLEKANRLLTKTENNLKDWRASAKFVRSKVKGAESSKQRTSANADLPDLFDRKRSKRPSQFGPLKKEIRATKQKLKTAKEDVSRIFPDVDHPDFASFGEGNLPGDLLWPLLYCLFVAITASLMALYPIPTEPTDEFFGLAFGVVFIAPIFMVIAFRNYSRKRHLPSHEIQSKLDFLKNEKMILEMSDSKLRKLKKELSELESDIEGSRRAIDVGKRGINLLEKEIPQLWDSIAHLIPFSTALEKA